MSGAAERPAGFLDPEQRDRVQASIEAAERRTSGEIRVVISRKVRGDPVDAARERFLKLGMQETKDRNGVLILLAVQTRKFAIYGDEGVHRLVGEEGWAHIRDGMEDRFRRGEFCEGLVYAVGEVARVLEEHFPWSARDVNELSDEVVEE